MPHKHSEYLRLQGLRHSTTTQWQTYTELKNYIRPKPMNSNATYHKSAKGTEAIATRQHGLSPKLRSMLIMVDGKRSFDELAKVASALGDPAQLMSELEAGGFIEQVSGAITNATTRTDTSAAAPPVPPAISLPDAKRLAVRKLTDAMGPMAEDLCLRIEAARTTPEYLAAITRAESFLRQTRGNAIASAFAAETAGQSPRD